MTKNNTLTRKNGPETIIQLHQTEIVKILPLDLEGKKIKVTLNSGGWMTSTTKKRMNEAGSLYADGKFQVTQKAGNWFVRIYVFARPTSHDSLVLDNNPFSFDDEITVLDPLTKVWMWKKLPFIDGMEFELDLFPK